MMGQNVLDLSNREERRKICLYLFVRNKESTIVTDLWPQLATKMPWMDSQTLITPGSKKAGRIYKVN